MKMFQNCRRLLPVMGMLLIEISSFDIVHAQVTNKMTTLRVAYPPGGPADVAARRIQLGLSNELSQSVIVENVPGAAGSIGATNVLSSASDGQTLLVTTGNDLILAPLALSHVKYKPESFKLLATIFPTDFALVTNADYSFKSIDELVDQTRASSKEVSMGSWGYGSAPFLVNADFKLVSGIRVLDVPYKGAAPVIQALLTKEIDMAFVPLAPSVVELISTGKIKLIGVANMQRNPFLPNAPTINEGKYLKNFVYSAWAGIFAPAGVPESKVQALTKVLGEIVLSDQYQRFLKDSAALPVQSMTPEQLASHFHTEMEKFRSIAKRINLVPQ